MEPVGLDVYKRGRWCTVAKLTPVDGEIALAVAHRHQRGVSTTISIPVVAFNYGREHGAVTLYFRRDQTGEMWRLPLSEVQRQGRLQTSCGVVEWFIPIASLRPVPWQAWPFARRTVRLGETQAPALDLQPALL